MSMMRKGPTRHHRGPRAVARAVTRCVRCGCAPDLYDVERRRVIAGTRHVDVIVCKDCRTAHASSLTAHEKRAFACADEMDDMEFMQSFDCDPEIVRAYALDVFGHEQCMRESAETIAFAQRVKDEREKWRSKERVEIDDDDVDEFAMYDHSHDMEDDFHPDMVD
jgi:hypothetical protein